MSEAQFDELPSGTEPENIQVQWHLVHAQSVASSLAAIAAVNDHESRTWLGTLYLTYQQQAGSSPGLDWAMAHTEVEIADDAAGTYLELGAYTCPYDTLMLETAGDYYVIRHEPMLVHSQRDLPYLPLMRFQLLLGSDIKGQMIGDQHSRDQMGGFVGNMLNAAVIYFKLNEDNDQVNPIFDMFRVFMMYLGDQGYSPKYTPDIDMLATGEFTINLYHREFDAGIGVTLNMANIAAQFEHMLQLQRTDGQENLSNLIYDTESEDIG